jgi:hypothetical protein
MTSTSTSKSSWDPVANLKDLFALIVGLLALVGFTAFGPDPES